MYYPKVRYKNEMLTPPRACYRNANENLRMFEFLNGASSACIVLFVVLLCGRNDILFCSFTFVTQRKPTLQCSLTQNQTYNLCHGIVTVSTVLKTLGIYKMGSNFVIKFYCVVFTSFKDLPLVRNFILL